MNTSGFILNILTYLLGHGRFGGCRLLAIALGCAIYRLPDLRSNLIILVTGLSIRDESYMVGCDLVYG